MEPMMMKCAIIDDSATHRALLEQFIENHSRLSLSGSYRNGVEAKNNQCEMNADIVFIDVEMPFVDGFDVLESFSRQPQIVMVSGSSDHALKAFEYDVADYLLKPLCLHRFNAAIKKVQRNIGILNDRDSTEHIFVRSNFKKVRVDYKDIKWIEALGDYVKLVTEKKNILVLSSMKAIEGRLPEDNFLRIHKSYIVNLKRIETFSNTIVQVGGKQLPLSRKRKSKFLSVLK
ncbi:LytTR family DNA-binding domain-containing protein [Pricia sp. S334]|uniref:LytTR family DNA-binding domain-containing protein n=1 Tax=Pricia mediterranea TaxID=3076079 RepID=A0ABU3L1V5_9FLAO|nr:LytTR family DNA-binding domain-containing protein [Pricia sp. S334]MDT7827097.1 LytTR family DNA-binding domain-containing protein [Pricia sp. S334]